MSERCRNKTEINSCVIKIMIVLVSMIIMVWCVKIIQMKIIVKQVIKNVEIEVEILIDL